MISDAIKRAQGLWYESTIDRSIFCQMDLKGGFCS